MVLCWLKWLYLPFSELKLFEMAPILFIFFISLFIRVINLYTLNLDTNSYIIEDQVLYWNWSMAKAFTVHSEIEVTDLLERMPGSFLFFQLIILLLGKSLFGILSFQIVVDSINCVLISLTAKEIKKSLFLLSGILSACSPLMLIISSQMLSDTIFLFFFLIFIYFFIIFLKKEKIYALVLCALFLGISAYIRTISAPLIVCVAITFLIIDFINKKNLNHTGIRNLIIFIILAFLPISERVFSNFINYKTFGLTTQKGTHLAYWVVPAVLDFASEEKKIDYYNKLNKIKSEYSIEENPFLQSNRFSRFAMEILYNSDLKDIVLAWSKGAVINNFASPLLLDSRVRNLKHPSFYDNDRNIFLWLKEINGNSDYKSYKRIIILLFSTSLLFVIFFFLGLYELCKYNKLFFTLCLMIFFYFLLLIGPVYSPKYVHPLIGIIIIIECFALERIKRFLFIN